MLKTIQRHVHSRVYIQLIILGLVMLGLFAGVIYYIFSAQASLGLAAIGLVVGVVVGFAVGKIFKLAWHDTTRQVIMSLDRTSFILIALYIAFRIFGDQLLGDYFQGADLSVLSFSLLGGILLGRIISVWQGVQRILKAQGILQ